MHQDSDEILLMDKSCMTLRTLNYGNYGPYYGSCRILSINSSILIPLNPRPFVTPGAARSPS